MKIAITGVPGTGKTRISKLLTEKLGYRLIQINEFAAELDAFVGYDEKMKSKILDMNKLKKEIKKLKGDFIIEGHTSHLFPVDVIIVLRCNPKNLKKRLKEKFSNNPQKIQVNLEAEILGAITSESIMNNKKVHEIDTADKSIEETVSEILKILKKDSEKYNAGKIDWLEEFSDWIDTS
jgi:adenylate kinase